MAQAEGHAWERAWASPPLKQFPSVTALKPPPGSPGGPEEPALLLCCFHFCFSFGRGKGGQLLLSSCSTGPHSPAQMCQPLWDG